ncbi:MAG: hypothetical protein HY863_21150 [Chloroflexi bacterium]|nr:hypothetical protein [Chloroflexota bacterium]
MNPLAPDEKTAMVMVYTQNMLARGEVIAKENARVSIWLRTQGVPNYIHLFKPQVISFGGTPPKPLSFSEIFIPTTQVIGFHLVPPAQDSMDYDVSEVNRVMQPLEILVGTFLLKGHIRVSSQAELSTSLDVMRAAWVSIYDADISNPYLPQFNLHVPMLLVNPNQVSFGLV